MTQAAIDLRDVSMPKPELPAPFPWFGGKSRVAPIVWQAFGDVHNYVEPFAGSLAVLLGRPTEPKIETVNDLDCYLANFWRALQAEHDAVAKWCDWPVNEADLHARHAWLVEQREWLRGHVTTDPHFYDAKIAGWWVWGLCAWIGGEWCSGKLYKRRPHLARFGHGIHRSQPHGGSVSEWLRLLASRLRRVRVACGDWSRVLAPVVTHGNGLTGVFLDPPYADTAKRHRYIYAAESLSVAHEAREWAIAHGDDPRLRIALCGYEGEHEMPSSWTTVAWRTATAFNGNGIDTADSAGRERIWFSPHCLPLEVSRQRELFEGGAR